ncbi:hypothetical protein WA158_001470 [Blastocystis sp. Blastoise]
MSVPQNPLLNSSTTDSFLNNFDLKEKEEILLQLRDIIKSLKSNSNSITLDDFQNYVKGFNPLLQQMLNMQGFAISTDGDISHSDLSRVTDDMNESNKKNTNFNSYCKDGDIIPPFNVSQQIKDLYAQMEQDYAEISAVSKEEIKYTLLTPTKLENKRFIHNLTTQNSIKTNDIKKEEPLYIFSDKDIQVFTEKEYISTLNIDKNTHFPVVSEQKTPFIPYQQVNMNIICNNKSEENAITVVSSPTDIHIATFVHLPPSQPIQRSSSPVSIPSLSSTSTVIPVGTNTTIEPVVNVNSLKNHDSRENISVETSIKSDPKVSVEINLNNDNNDTNVPIKQEESILSMRTNILPSSPDVISVTSQQPIITTQSSLPVSNTIEKVEPQIDHVTEEQNHDIDNIIATNVKETTKSSPNKTSTQNIISSSSPSSSLSPTVTPLPNEIETSLSPEVQSESIQSISSSSSISNIDKSSHSQRHNQSNHSHRSISPIPKGKNETTSDSVVKDDKSNLIPEKKKDRHTSRSHGRHVIAETSEEGDSTSDHDKEIEEEEYHVNHSTSHKKKSVKAEVIQFTEGLNILKRIKQNTEVTQFPFESIFNSKDYKDMIKSHIDFEVIENYIKNNTITNPEQLRKYLSKMTINLSVAAEGPLKAKILSVGEVFENLGVENVESPTTTSKPQKKKTSENTKKRKYEEEPPSPDISPRESETEGRRSSRKRRATNRALPPEPEEEPRQKRRTSQRKK